MFRNITTADHNNRISLSLFRNILSLYDSNFAIIRFTRLYVETSTAVRFRFSNGDICNQYFERQIEANVNREKIAKRQENITVFNSIPVLLSWKEKGSSIRNV